MRTFTIIWLGQLVSTLGSYMTFFSLTLWIWEQTGSVTALALISFFLQLPQIFSNLFAGLIVDRFNRKHLMLLGDAVTMLDVLTIGILHRTDHLAIWHLYVVAVIAGGFSQIQLLAYQTSLTQIVPKDQYTRAGAMAAMLHYGANILGPAFAGMLYPTIGLSGVIAVDICTFSIAFITLASATIPQPNLKNPTSKTQLFRSLTFGFREVWRQPSLQCLLLITVLFAFAHDLGGALYQPMILARTGGEAQLLAMVSAAAGIGGVVGAVMTTIWGGPKRRIYGMLGGFIGAGICKLIFGLGRSVVIWLPAQVCSSLNFPVLGSCRSALWIEAIAPEDQGRVFAANSMITQIFSAIAVLSAGPLADRFFEPAMRSDGLFANTFSPIFGSGAGSGMAMLYSSCAVAMLVVGISGFYLSQLMKIES
ncbi:MAG: MFS transporter [Limnothrix sp. RL_2_0]|nr:MFS transporter [Limnothrix sp. RL_2_0]